MQSRMEFKNINSQNSWWGAENEGTDFLICSSRANQHQVNEHTRKIQEVATYDILLQKGNKFTAAESMGKKITAVEMEIAEELLLHKGKKVIVVEMETSDDDSDNPASKPT